MADVLRENPIRSTREYRNRPRTKVAKRIQAFGIGQNVDGFELDRTDREKLLEFQTARSARLPENL